MTIGQIFFAIFAAFFGILMGLTAPPKYAPSRAWTFFFIRMAMAFILVFALGYFFFD